MTTVVTSEPASAKRGRTGRRAWVVSGMALLVVGLAVGSVTVVGWLSVEVGKVLVHRPRPPAAALHALSRLYLVAHYLTDVVASVVFAGASVLVVTALAAPALPWVRTRLRPRAGESERRDA